MQNLAIYLHWPFCERKCPYCDFNSHVRSSIDEDRWKAAYTSELYKIKALFDNFKIISIFFGGGTPSLMSPDTVAHILSTLSTLAKNNIADDTEITLEANPCSVERSKMLDFRSVGINRISLGVQSLRDESLAFLGRLHSAQQALEALETTASIFDNYSLDLIYNLPDHTPEIWAPELEEALTYVGDHISLYQLTIEHGTKFDLMYKAGKLMMPAEEISAEIYTYTNDALSSAGFDHYEVSNYARNKKYSVHNMHYWNYGYYLGIGPGAHSRLPVALSIFADDCDRSFDNLNFTINQRLQDDVRYAIECVKSPETWLNGVLQSREPAFAPKSTPIYISQSLNAQEKACERIMMGMRLQSGMNLWDIRDHLDFEALNRLLKYGLVVFHDANHNKIRSISESLDIDNIALLRLLQHYNLAATKRGLLVLNSVIHNLIA